MERSDVRKRRGEHTAMAVDREAMLQVAKQHRELAEKHIESAAYIEGLVAASPDAHVC